MRSIQKGVVMPIGSEFPSIRELGAVFRLKTHNSGWLKPLLYTLKLMFFVLVVFPPALVFWFSLIAAKGDVNYLLAEFSLVLQNMSAESLSTATTSAYCLVALFGVLLVAFYMLLFPYRKPSTSYVVERANNTNGKDHAIPASARRAPQ